MTDIYVNTPIRTNAFYKFVGLDALCKAGRLFTNDFELVDNLSSFRPHPQMS